MTIIAAVANPESRDRTISAARSASAATSLPTFFEAVVQNLLVAVSPRDAATLAAAALTMLVASLCAASFPT